MRVNRTMTNGTNSVQQNTIRAMLEGHKDTNSIELPVWVVKAMIETIDELHFKEMNLNTLIAYVKQIES